ncbi:MAG TPA: outer membrane beta-barrel protein [Rubricoccaceae bacterium]|jgi:opacity protein-like surface antigen
MRLVLLILLVVPAAAHAQRARPFAEKGDLALVVGVAGLTDLSPAFGGIGVRYRVADRTVIGTSLGLGFGTEDADDENRVSTRTSATLAVWNENHLGRRGGIVSPFVGAGATFGVQRFEADFDGIPCDPASCPDTPGGFSQSETTLSIGVGALLGAEVRIARGVTLGAAYTLGIAVDRRESDRSNPFGSNDSVRSTFVRGGTDLTDLSLSVYF